MAGAAPQLTVRPSAQLQLTPQLQQALRLLQLSSLELQQEVQQQLLDNPFLELDGEEAQSSENIASSSDMATISESNDAEIHENQAEQAPELSDLSWELAAANPEDWDDDRPGPRSAAASDDDAAPGAWELAASSPTLADFLRQQAANLRLTAPERAALDYLIGNLREDGYLDGDLPELAASLAPDADEETRDALLHTLQLALALLHSMEPAGVGARNVAECLRLQLRHAWAAAPQAGDSAAGEGEHAALYPLALALCEQPLALLARKDVRTLAQRCAAPPEQVAQALRWIARLEPQPARRFVPIAHTTLVPDVLVQAGRQGLRVQLNPEVLPRLNVHALYAAALRQQRGHASYAGLHSQLQEARWYVKNLTQRFDTILRVAQAIVQQQRGFFVHGPVAMRPLVLREVAEQLQLHTSTISRAVNGKFMATPQGTFEFSYFFSSGVQTDTGGSTSSTAVQAVIGQLIAAENPQKPLSDAKIADLLAAQGIECARRTVAKYREALNIPATSLRKTV